MPDFMKFIRTAAVYTAYTSCMALMVQMASPALFAGNTAEIRDGTEIRDKTEIQDETAPRSSKSSAQNARPEVIQEIIEEARTRCRGMRGAFSMPVNAVHDDLDLNRDGNPDYLIDGTAFKCNRGNSRTFQTGPQRRNQQITLIMSDDRHSYTVHQFNTNAYDIIRFNNEDVLMLHEPKESCSRKRANQSRTRYRQDEEQQPGCYRALVWRGGIFAAAR